MSWRYIFRKWDRWLLTSPGVYVAHGLTAVTWLGYPFFCVGRELHLVSTWINNFDQLNFDIPVPLTQDLDDLAESEYRKSGLHDNLQYRIDMFKETFHRCAFFYMTSSFDVVSYGCAKSPKGVFVGLPLYLTFTTPEDVKRAENLICLPGLKGRALNWDGRFGEEMSAALILSDDAKKFVIQRELLKRADASYVAMKPAVYWLFVGGAAASCFVSNRTFGLLKGPRAVRFFMYFSAYSLAFVAFSRLTKALVQHHELKADRETAIRGDEYINGGIEYYEKLLWRNKLVREALVGTTNSKLKFTKDGDYASQRKLIEFNPKVSILQRLQTIRNVQEEKRIDPAKFPPVEWKDDEESILNLPRHPKFSF